MAPELFGGVKDEVTVPVTVESDVWAFGCLCLEASTGSSLFSPIKMFTLFIYFLDYDWLFSLGRRQKRHESCQR